MKKTLLILNLLIAVGVTGLWGQVAPTITVGGTSGTVDLTSTTVFNVNITLSVDQALGAGVNVTSLNLLLATPSTGVNSGAPYFTVYFLSPSATFTLANSSSSAASQSAFNTAGTGANAGYNISTPSLDLGANGSPGATPPFSILLVDTLRFTIDPSTPAGTYQFRATLGWDADANGSSISVSDNSGPDAGGTYAVTDAPLFEITVIPEPSTWALVAFGGLGFAAVTIRRRRWVTSCQVPFKPSEFHKFSGLTRMRLRR